MRGRSYYAARREKRELRYYPNSGVRITPLEASLVSWEYNKLAIRLEVEEGDFKMNKIRVRGSMQTRRKIPGFEYFSNKYYETLAYVEEGWRRKLAAFPSMPYDVIIKDLEWWLAKWADTPWARLTKEQVNVYVNNPQERKEATWAREVPWP